MTSRGPSSAAVSALLDRPAAAQASGTASSTRSGAGASTNGSQFQSLLAGGRSANAPAAADTDKRKTRIAADDPSDSSSASAAAPPAAASAGIATGTSVALSATRSPGASGAPETAGPAGESAQSSSSTVASASAGSGAYARSGAVTAPDGSAASNPSANPDALPQFPQALAVESDPAALAGNLTSASTVAVLNGSIRSDARGVAAAGAEDSSANTAGGSRDASLPPPPTGVRGATPDAAASADPEQQLLAWLSGTADLQSGAAGPVTAGSATAGPTAVGPIAAGPGGAGAAGAAAAELTLAASGTLSAQGAPGSSAPGASSDTARTDSLSTDPSQNASPLLATNAAPFHLAAAHAESAQQATATLQSPLGSSAWVEELGAQISWMANQGIDTASLHVSPAELGPIEVRIAVHGSNASVWFGAAQATTRAALEQALPQLRHLFSSQGLALADAGVFREPPRGSARQAPARSLTPLGAVSEQATRTPQTQAAARLGLLDLYA